MAKTPRAWTGARTPSGLKRVRQSERRHDVLQPRRSTAKTLVAKAIRTATAPTNGSDPHLALAEAISALDRAAKAGAIHRNAAARRKSRLTLTINAALGGAHVQAGHVAKTTGKAAAAKAAKARIAAGKAGKAKGAQTAAGKARAALSKTARTETTEAKATTTADAPAPKTGRTRAAATKPTAKAASTKAPAKASAARASSAKATAAKAAAKPASATSRSTSKTAATGSKTASRTKKTD